MDNDMAKGIMKALDLKADNAALRERLAALVWSDLSGLHRTGGVTFCAYCVNGEALTDSEPFDHAPDCPIVLGRAALARGAGR